MTFYFFVKKKRLTLLPKSWLAADGAVRCRAWLTPCSACLWGRYFWTLVPERLLWHAVVLSEAAPPRRQPSGKVAKRNGGMWGEEHLVFSEFALTGNMKDGGDLHRAGSRYGPVFVLLQAFRKVSRDIPLLGSFTCLPNDNLSHPWWSHTVDLGPFCVRNWCINELITPFLQCSVVVFWSCVENEFQLTLLCVKYQPASS